MTDETDLDLYRKMYLIRSAETAIQKHYFDDEMKTPMHMSMGEEAIVAGICHALKPEDQVMGSYRSHALYLAKTNETDKFFGEMYGRVTGTARGKAGSMHLADPDAGLICTSAIVASHIPVAVGAAFANKNQKNGKVVAVFFGDGAIDEGVFYESLNAAALWKLPVVFVCEDNGIAVHIADKQRHGYSSIADIVSQFDVQVHRSESTDAAEVLGIAMHAVAQVRNGNGPAFLHMKYYRYLEHVGISEDFKAGYRSRDEFEAWEARDPVRLMRDRLAKEMSESDLRELEDAIDNRVEGSRKAAQDAPLPSLNVAYEDVLS